MLHISILSCPYADILAYSSHLPISSYLMIGLRPSNIMAICRDFYDASASSQMISRRCVLRSIDYICPSCLAQQGALGSPPMMGLLRTLKPAWWFSAHLHVKYEATVHHTPTSETGARAPQPELLKAGENPDEIDIEFDDEESSGKPAQQEGGKTEHSAQLTGNPDEITLDESEDVAKPDQPPTPSAQGRAETKFLALDKCLPQRNDLPQRQYLEVTCGC